MCSGLCGGSFYCRHQFRGADEAKVYWAAKFVREWPIGYRLLSGVCALITTAIAGVILVTLRRRIALK
jgi:hypothetical protein